MSDSRRYNDDEDNVDGSSPRDLRERSRSRSRDRGDYNDYNKEENVDYQENSVRETEEPVSGGTIYCANLNYKVNL